MTTNPLDLNISIADVDTSMPVLVAGPKEVVISDAALEPNKDQTGINMKVEFTTTEPCEATNGSTLGAGMKVTRYYPMQPSPKNADWDFRRDPTVLFQAVYGDTPPNISADSVAGLIGNKVIIITKVRAAQGEYGESAEISRVKAL